MCHRRHHTLLHIDKKNQASNEPTSTTSNPPADVKDTPTPEINTYCSFKGQPQTHILLATAIVEVRNRFGQYVPCRVLLDSASQSHFITERCVQLLKLTKTRTHAAIQVNTATHHREMCTSVEVNKDPDLCSHTGHKQGKHCHTSQSVNSHEIQAHRLA